MAQIVVEWEQLEEVEVAAAVVAEILVQDEVEQAKVDGELLQRDDKARDVVAPHVAAVEEQRSEEVRHEVHRIVEVGKGRQHSSYHHLPSAVVSLHFENFWMIRAHLPTPCDA